MPESEQRADSLLPSVEEAAALVPGPDSITWRISGDARILTTAGYALVAVGAVAAAAAVGCLAGGLVVRKEYQPYVGEDGTTKYVDMTRAQAENKSKVAGGLLIGSLVAALVAAGSGTTAAIVW